MSAPKSKKKGKRSPLDVCSDSVTPACLQSLYGIPTTPSTQASNSLGVAGFLDQYAETADLESFMDTYRSDLTSYKQFTVQSVDDGVNTQGSDEAGVEANLDIQYTVGVASNVPTTFYTVGNNPTTASGVFLDLLNYVLAESNPPKVLSTSYAYNEDDWTTDLATKMCNSYAQLGARGVTLLFASGDGGVAGIQAESCSTFVPTFPSTCPFVTSVGGTSGTGPETAAGFSGGGFSNIFTIPSYQNTSVTTYVTGMGSSNKGKFNPKGRGFPDVSAQAIDVEIVNDGDEVLVDGTSCSTPIFAGLVALLNDRLIAAGKSPLGFLNPWLYANPTALTDITSGSNPGCVSNGFSAKAGWDAVTGLGSPNFAALAKAAGVSV